MDLEGSPRPLRRPRRLLLRTATLTVALLSVPAAALATHVFSDVPHSHPHAKGIGYVSETGVTQGCDGSRYCPGDGLTRAQMGTFLYRASGNDPDTPPSVNAARLQGQTASQLRSGVDAARLQGLQASAFARTSDLPKVTTVTESVGCVGTSFMPAVSSHGYGTVSNHGRYLTSTGGVDCQVDLPHGARLTSAVFRVSDNSTTQAVSAVRVMRRTLMATSQTTLASQTSVTTAAGTPGQVTVTLPISGPNAVVDNATYGYTLEASLGASNPDSSQYVHIVGAMVTYEVDRLVP